MRICFFSFFSGQVVVLVPVETEETNEDIDDKKMPTTKQRLVVAKMSQKSSDQAVLKGVITKSPYIEAYCPKGGCKLIILFIYKNIIHFTQEALWYFPLLNPRL